MKAKTRTHRRAPMSHIELHALQRDTFDYFLKESNPSNGLIPDNTRKGAPVSIAVMGLALAAFPVGVERRFLSRAEAIKRTLTILRDFWNSPQGEQPDARGYKGFFYHFLDIQVVYMERLHWVPSELLLLSLVLTNCLGSHLNFLLINSHGFLAGLYGTD